MGAKETWHPTERLQNSFGPKIDSWVGDVSKIKQIDKLTGQRIKFDVLLESRINQFWVLDYLISLEPIL